nr:D610 [uncultured bacterium]
MTVDCVVTFDDVSCREKFPLLRRLSDDLTLPNNSWDGAEKATLNADRLMVNPAFHVQRSSFILVVQRHLWIRLD